MRGPRVRAAALALAGLVVGIIPAQAAEKLSLRVDEGFGDKGSVITKFGSGPTGDSSASSVGLQKDGRIVVAGTKGRMGIFDRYQGGADPADFALARYKADGSLDTSFGKGGKVTTELKGKDRSNAMVIQPDGKIVAAGESCGRDPGGQGTSDDCFFAVARYRANGKLDPAFGNGGVTTTEIGYAATIAALALSPKGEILAVGSGAGGPPTKTPERPEGATAVVRYTPTGILDKGFGKEGIKSINLGANNGTLDFGMLVQPDGKVIVAVAGDSEGPTQGPGTGNFVLVRLNTDGSLDDGGPADATAGDLFGTGGKTSTDFGGSADVVAGLVIQGDGKLVVAGSKQTDKESHFLLARYDTNGALDPSFGSGGSVVAPPGQQGTAEAIALGPGDSLVVAGSTLVEGTSSTKNPKFALATYGKDGAPLPAGGSGDLEMTLSDVGPAGGSDVAKSVAVSPDGGVIVAGETAKKPSGATDMALVRYGDSVPGSKNAPAPDSAPTNKAPYLIGLALLLAIAATVVLARRRRA